MKEKFDVIFLEDAADFLEELDEKAREKIIYNIHKSQRIIDPELFKKLSDQIWEFRTLYNKKCYRLFAFWDNRKNTIVIVTNGIVKKSAKAPVNEIRKAEKLRDNYFE